MAKRMVRVVWVELPDGSSPAGRPAELTIDWPDALPLPVVGELLETATANRTVLEVTARSYFVGDGGDPIPIILCRPVGR